MIIKQKVWLIMSKDRKYIAKGPPRNRYLIEVNSKDNKRFLTYSTENKARSAFENHGFYGCISKENLEPVEFEISMKEIK